MVKCKEALYYSECGLDICCYECKDYDNCPLACETKDHECCYKRIETGGDK